MAYNGGPFTSAAQYYVANFLPVALKLPGIKEGDPNTIIVAKNPTEPHLPNVSTHMESVYYNANPALDADHDGVITYGDIQNVLARVAAGKTYHSALAQLQNNTGYEPSQNHNSMVATNKPTAPPINSALPSNDVDSILNRYLEEIAASEKYNKKLYKRYLPQHHLVIRVNAADYTEAIEFSRILSSALSEDLLARAFVHTDGQLVDVECCIRGPQEDCFKTVEQLTNIIAKTFTVAIKKTGTPTVTTQFFMNKKSSYQPISLEASLFQHKKFLLKFI